MSFEVLPAADVAGGRLARFADGRRVASAAFGGEVKAAIAAFREAGATWVHVVDMDLAFDGTIGNAQVVAHAAASGLSVQAAGGVRSRGDVLTLLEAGADRVVLGSAALTERDRVERLVAEFGERLVIGLEVDGEVLRPRGRDADLRLSLTGVLAWLAGIPVSRYLVTAVARVGTERGPDLRALGTVRNAVTAPVLCAGGIASAEQVRLVKDAGSAGVVLGYAVLEGELPLDQALAAAGD